MGIVKRILVIALIGIFITGFIGCSSIGKKISDKASEQIGEKVGEKLLENAFDADVDITDDGMKLQTDDGTFEFGDSLEWPGDSMGKVPAINGRVTGIMEGESWCMISFEEMESDSVDSYLEDLESKGYAKTSIIKESDGFIMYTGSHEDGSSVTFLHNGPQGDGSITYDMGS